MAAWNPEHMYISKCWISSFEMLGQAFTIAALSWSFFSGSFCFQNYEKPL